MDLELEKLLKDSRYAACAMTYKEEDSALYRWIRKPVKENLLLDPMESLANVTLSGPGTCSVTHEQSHDGKPCIKVECPTVMEPIAEENRSYSFTRLVFRAGGANWRRYNRISFWVYPDCPGCHNVWISMTLNNDGEVKYPREKYFEGTHHANVKNGQWNQFIWEFPYVYRDRVTSISINFNIHGSQCDMSDHAVLYCSRLELQVVDADHYEGWELDDRIAFCHSGYQPGAEKIALSQNIQADAFAILDANTGKPVFNGPLEAVTTSLGSFQRMNFTALDTPGSYLICAGNRKTKPFRIDAGNWESAVWKTINFFSRERCGTEVAGTHLPCHLDCFCIHPDGRKISVGGGWHDAGDMSQGEINTSESIQAFIDMADKVKDRKPALYDRLLEEARWGLNWLMRTRFGDGYRCMWTTIGVWTKNIIGDADDLSEQAYNDPFGNFCGAAAEAAGARIFRNVDPVFADYCLRCAEADFKFAYERMYINHPKIMRNVMGETITEGQALVATAELYKTTGKAEYLERAAIFAEHVLLCQQQDNPDWDIPIRGFFYDSREHRHPLAYSHRSHEQAPVVGLGMLCELAPEHPKYPEWKKGVALYAEYLKKTSPYSAPYGILPGSVYKIGVPWRKEFAEDYDVQVKKGIRLSSEYYLRIFPVAVKFRGFFGVLLSKAKAASTAARVLHDKELLELAQRQLEWVVGKNPFAQSFMFGEGYDFPPMYSEFSNDMTGEIPVGIQTFENNDVPFMPMMNSATYKEVWVHSSSRFLWTVADIYPSSGQ